MKIKLFVIMICCISLQTTAQVDSGKTGAWYMYFYDTQFKESRFGAQGDVQYRNWNLGGDLEQLLYDRESLLGQKALTPNLL